MEYGGSVPSPIGDVKNTDVRERVVMIDPGYVRLFQLPKRVWSRSIL
jgi:hypothetical protein